MFKTKIKDWDLIWNLSLEDLRFEEKLEFEIWDLAKWFQSICWLIWDLTVRFDWDLPITGRLFLTVGCRMQNSAVIRPDNRLIEQKLAKSGTIRILL